ncbi:hypothetical protein CERSUDRAFT_57994, partial [Gelatoporia subvermispora B]
VKDIPGWLPFTEFKGKAEAWRAQMLEFADRPLRQVKQKMRDGTADPSLVFYASAIRWRWRKCARLTPGEEHTLKWAANSIFGGSIDTTAVVIYHVLLYMMQSPDKFKKARDELDSVVKRRLPTFDDRPELPYTECVLSEVLTLSCPVPICLPHSVREENRYAGYRIPKDTIVSVYCHIRLCARASHI